MTLCRRIDTINFIYFLMLFLTESSNYWLRKACFINLN
nr:MAG TPA: hypothetical protein [Caudoviricetes sp.]